MNAPKLACWIVIDFNVADWKMFLSFHFINVGLIPIFKKHVGDLKVEFEDFALASAVIYGHNTATMLATR